MRNLEIVSLLLAIFLFSDFDANRWETAYGVVDPGEPLDLESDF